METVGKAAAIREQPRKKGLARKQKGDRSSMPKVKRSRKSKDRHKCKCIILTSLSGMIESSTVSDDVDYGTSDVNQLRTLIHYPGWEKKVIPPSSPMHQLKWKPRVDDRVLSLLDPILSWEEKVLKVLHMIRRRELTEYNSKLGFSVLTRFCQFNIALFDLDKESEVEPGPRFSEIPESDYFDLDNSINVISIRIDESDVPYPISVYGTVLARDQNDYRCVYLFKRGRDDPQLITQMDDTLTLTGPYRALSGLGSMFFEFHLKIRGDVEVDDQDFSKGLLQRDDCCDDLCESRTLSLRSCLSKVDFLYTPIPSAVQASIEVNILNGKSNFIGKITASTGASKNKIILYDSEVPGTELNLGRGGSVWLTRSIVSVTYDEDLVLNISVSEDGDCSYTTQKLVLDPGEECITLMLGSYELQLKIIWTGVFRQKRPNMWRKINHTLMLL